MSVVFCFPQSSFLSKEERRKKKNPEKKSFCSNPSYYKKADPQTQLRQTQLEVPT